jgi:hypothetical protein
MYGFIALQLLVTSSGWSADLHKIIGRIASALIRNDKTERMLVSILSPERSRSIESLMDEYSSFADTDSAGSESKSQWHFANMAKQECHTGGKFDPGKHCISRGDCIVPIMVNMLSTITDPTTSPEQKSFALKYIIHLMGDIHQPLHLGFEEDKGGNLLYVVIPGMTHSDLVNTGGMMMNQGTGEASFSLHEVWDWVLRDKATRGMNWATHAEMMIAGIADTVYDNVVKLNDISETSLLNFFGSIATETFSSVTCVALYYRANPGNVWSSIPLNRGERLSSLYVNTRLAIVEQQLVKAGARLAYMLEVIARFWKPSFVAKDSPLETSGISHEPSAPLRNLYSALVDFVFGPDDETGDERSSETAESCMHTFCQQLFREDSGNERRGKLKLSMKSEWSPIVDKVDVRKLGIIKDANNGYVIVTTQDWIVQNPGQFPKIESGVMVFMGTSSDKSHVLPLGIHVSAIGGGLNHRIIRRYFQYLAGFGESPSSIGSDAMVARLDAAIGDNVMWYNVKELEDEFFNKIDEWVIVKVRRGFVVLTIRSNIQQDKSPRVFKFNTHRIFSARHNHHIILAIDVKLADEQPTQKVFNAILEMISSQTPEDTRRIQREFPSFVREINDLYSITIGTGESSGSITYLSTATRKDKPYLSSVGFVGKSK